GRGVRMTRQRRVLLKIMEDADRHLNAATLLEMARKQDPGIDRVTVYRTLTLLKKYGLIDELGLFLISGEGHYYEARPLRQHLHLACLGCGQVTEFESPYFEKIKRQLAREKNFHVAFARVEVGGYCGACRRAGRHRGQKNVDISLT